jgi:glycerol-3-phosphate O-acyltransferase/dihydroxyacetone phosphate acyltransferase
MHPIVAAGIFFYRLLKLLFLSILVIPGTTLFSLVFLSTKLISIQKAQEALAASNVKVQARDVMATWKLLVAMVVAPLAYAWYCIIGVYWYRYNNCNGYLPDGIHKRWLIVSQIIVYVTVTYGSLRFGEVAMDILKSLGPLWKAMNPFSNSELAKLQERRQHLATRVNDIINELGPEMYADFYSKRIIQDPFSDEHEVPPHTPARVKSDADATTEGPQEVETYDFPASPTSPGQSNDLPRNESFGDLANQDIFSSRPHTPKKSRSRNASSANLGSFTLKPFSTIDGNLEEVKKRLKDGVRQRMGRRRSSGVVLSGDAEYEDDNEELVMEQNGKRGMW